MSLRILSYLREHSVQTPLLVLDLDRIQQNFLELQNALPDSTLYYAVKANPAPEILSLLIELGCRFDCASCEEINMVLAHGAPPETLCYGNTIKKESAIAEAYAKGVRLYAADCREEFAKLARAAPGSQILCRLACEGTGAAWPLGHKFGCLAEEAVLLLTQAVEQGLHPAGVAFHVGSQQCSLAAWDEALTQAAFVYHHLERQGITLPLMNLGGGFPAFYTGEEPTATAIGNQIRQSLAKHFKDLPKPVTFFEPGRALVAEAGTIITEVVLISDRAIPNEPRWVYLDIGKFGGLAETMDECIRYPIFPLEPKPHSKMIPCVLAGPTCDSADILYRIRPYLLPEDLAIGDKLLITHAGAYTSTYASVAFNGFPPLATRFLPRSL